MSEQNTSADSNVANTDTVGGLRAVIDKMQTYENLRAADRALIDTLANGSRPYTPEECQKFGIKINVNWGELNRQIRDANRQVNSALVYKPTLFSCLCKGGETEKRDEYSQKFTANFNSVLLRGKGGKKFKFRLRSRNASFVLHGIGVLFWPNDHTAFPRFQALENLLIPTDTSLDFDDLSYFNVKVDLTPYEFAGITHGDAVMEGWDVDQVHKILDGLKELKFQNPNNYNWWHNPEQMQELFKQNKCYLDSDAVAKVKLNFFFEHDADDGKWYRKIFIRDTNDYTTADPEKFVFDSEQPFADDVDQILHVQYGDNNVVPPNKYHATRGLGQLLYSPAEVLNRFRSDFLQHAFEQLKMYFKVQNPVDRGRQNVIELMQYGIIEDGVSIVPENERHQVDGALIESVMSQCRQSLSENSASFVQDINDGTSKEMTLGEAQIRQQSVNATVSSMLMMAYDQEQFLGQELLRRFLLENSETSEVKKFQEQCVKDGIPKELMVVDNWIVNVEKVLGAGDQSLALQEATALFQSKAAFDPKSQRIIDRQFVATVTRDPAKAMMIVPENPTQATDGRLEAENVFGTVMDGILPTLREGIDQFGYIDGMLEMMEAVIGRITQSDNVGTPQDVIGLQTATRDVSRHIELIAADKKNGQKAKVYGDTLGKLTNLIKGFSQRQQQAAQKVQQTIGPEAQAKADAITHQSQVKIAAKEAEFEQKMQHREAQFEQKIEQQFRTNELNIKKMIAETMTQLLANRDLHAQQLTHDKQVHVQDLAAQVAGDAVKEDAAEKSAKK